MEDWRDLAVKLFPAHRRGWWSFKHEWISIYEIFQTLLEDAKQLHKEGNKRKTQKIYLYAEYCFYHLDRDVRNAVCTAFYEHLADQDETSAQILRQLVWRTSLAEMGTGFRYSRYRHRCHWAFFYSARRRCTSLTRQLQQLAWRLSPSKTECVC